MTYLSPAPLHHSAPCGSVALALLQGATVVMEHLDAAQFLDLVGRYRVTHSQVVPTMFSRLLKLPEPVREAADISSLDHQCCGFSSMVSKSSAGGGVTPQATGQPAPPGLSIEGA